MQDLIFAILAALSLVLTLWRWLVSERFPLHKRRAATTAPLPGVTVLKPLKGTNAEIPRCLRSWFLQRYNGPVQILFGVASADDPVCADVRRLQAEFPYVDADLVICSENLGANAKVSTLRQLEPHISHRFIMISDADVEVPPDFGASIVPMLGGENAGLINCFYRLANPATTAMHWEAIAINADFWTSVLQARSLKPVDFALGAVMSMPAAMLQKIGGFAPLSDYLADDYQLGRNVTAAGGRIEFAPIVVDCRENVFGWGEVWRHQLRWARTIRVCQPLPYFLSILGNSTLWPVAWAAHGENAAAAPFLIVSLLFRIVSGSYQQRRLTGSGQHAGYWWLIPVKDMLDVFIWALAYLGSHVEWRGERYHVLHGGKLIPVSSQIKIAKSRQFAEDADEPRRP